MDRRINVLLIEDDPDYSVLMGLHLNEACGSSMQFTMECADNLKAGLQLLVEKEFDVVLLDLMLPDSKGLESLIRTQSKAQGVPIVVLTSLTDEETGLDAVAHGAQDFLGKEKLDARLLKRTISYALERSHLLHQLENVIENSPDGMVVVDLQGIVRYVNPVAQSLFRRSKEEMLGKPFGHPMRPSKPIEIKLVSQEGDEKIAEMRVTEVEWKKYPAYIASIRDITELRKIEQIKAEIKQRRRIDQLKDEFLSTVSHEMRSPLAIIKAAVVNLRDQLAGPLAEPQANLVYIADRNIDRLARIINNLLDLSRLESGRAKINRQAVKTSKLIDDTVQGIRLTLGEKNIELESQVPTTLPEAYVDQDMIIQVLNNLVDNALRYAQSQVLVKARAISSDQILISIIDDGPGIAHEKIGELFNKFVQVNRPVGGGGYKGTGLGLAICHEILQANQGKIWVESEMGKGSQVHFLLPVYHKGMEGMELEHAISTEKKSSSGR